MIEYKPIETAPKDGSDIFAYETKGVPISVKWRRIELEDGYLGTWVYANAFLRLFQEEEISPVYWSPKTAGCECYQMECEADYQAFLKLAEVRKNRILKENGGNVLFMLTPPQKGCNVFLLSERDNKIFPFIWDLSIHDMIPFMDGRIFNSLELAQKYLDLNK